MGEDSEKPNLLRALSRPKIRIEPPPAARMIVRATERSTGRWGEITVELDPERASFRFLIDKPETK